MTIVADKGDTRHDGIRLLIGCMVAAAIAWLAPFDLAFSALTLGSPALRSLTIVALALIGGWAARRVGLGVGPRRLRRPILWPLIAAVGMAAYCLVIDLIFKSELSASYLRVMTTVPTAERILVFAARAYNENLIYRFFLGSVLTYIIASIYRRLTGKQSAFSYVAGFSISQIANIWINVSQFAPFTPLHAVHDALRYVAPGLIWAWLYCRHGFQSNEIACTSVHVFLQPLLTLGLR